MSFAELDLDFLEKESRRSRQDSAEESSDLFLDLAMLRPQYLSAATESPPFRLPLFSDKLEATLEPLASPEILALEQSVWEGPPPPHDFVGPETLLAPQVIHVPPQPEPGIETRRELEQTPAEAVAQAFAPQGVPARSKRRSWPSFRQAIQKFITILQGRILIGLDLGSRSLKYVALRKAATGYQVTDYDYIELPRSTTLANLELSEQEKERILTEQLQEFLAGKPLQRGQIALAVSGLDVLVRQHLLPPMTKKDLARAMPWAMRKDLPFPVEAALTDFALVGTRRHANIEKMEVVAVAAPVAVVERQLAQLQGNKVTPHKVSTAAIALWNLLLQDPRSHEQNALIIDIGAASTHMVFVDHGRLQFVREITTAGDDFTEALTGTVYAAGREIALSPSAAERLKHDYGLPAVNTKGTTTSGIPLAEMAVMMRPVVERLVSEIQRSMDYYREKFKAGALQHIYLTGGGALLKNLDSVLSAGLAVTAERFDPFASLAPEQGPAVEKLAEVAPHLSVALGLALDRRKELNLLPPELKGAARLRTVQRSFRFIVALAASAILGMTGIAYLQSQQFGADLSRLRHDYQRLLPRHQLYVELSQELAALRSRLAAYQSHVAVHLTAPEHLRALSNLIPPSITLTAVDFEVMAEGNDASQGEQGPGDPQLPDLVMIHGVVLKSPPGGGANAPKEGVRLADFLISLEQSGYFRSIDLRRQELRPDGSISFTLACLF